MCPRLNPDVLSCLVEDFSPIRAALADPDFIPLAVAEPYIYPPDHVFAAMREAVDARLSRYGPRPGLLELRRAIAEKLLRRNGIAADPESEILVTQGAGHGFLLAMIAFLQPGDEVLTADPSFPLNWGTSQLLGARVVSCPIDGPGGIDELPDRMAEAITPRTRLIVLNNPNNPTGDLLPRPVLERIAMLAQEHDLAVLSDEVYERFVYDGAEMVSIGSLPGMRERTVTLFGFSKDYCISGLRVGYLVASPQIVAAISRIQQNDGHGANVPGQRAALAALTGPQDYVDDLVVALDAARRLTVETLNRIAGVRCALPPAGYFVFPDLSRYGDDGELFGALIDRAKIGLAPGAWYGQRGRGRMRLVYAAVPADRLAVGLDRLAGFLEQRPPREG